jgi:hypothetical protein
MLFGPILAGPVGWLIFGPDKAERMDIRINFISLSVLESSREFLECTMYDVKLTLGHQR